MWQLDNRTPFAADRTWVRDRDGAEIWIVVVKATFAMQPEQTLKIADVQPPPVKMPVYNGKTGVSSLRYDSDFARTKLTTDVILNASAHAPQGQAVEQLDASFAVGPVVKTVRVIGDRAWQRGSISAPVPFVSMPLVFDRAYGGKDPHVADPEHPSLDMRNPAGTGWLAASEHADAIALPNLEDPRQPIKAWDDRPPPTGVGVVSCHWQPRAALAGTYDQRWQETRLPLLPEDFDDRHYQCAPADQQTPQFLHGGEAVALRNLTPGGGDFRFFLPRMYLGFETFFFTGERARHPPAKLHTVIVEPDEARVSLVWHTALPCHSKVLKLKHTRILLKQDLRDGVLGRQDAEETV